jgi:hypothetical protein
MRAPRHLFRVTCCALLALAVSRPARSASVTADFDGDGILDTATLEPGGRPVIRVTLSTAAQPLLIVLKEHPVALVAADINRDGLMDLAGMSRRRTLWFFTNDGEGFTRLHRHVRGRQRSNSTLSVPGPHVRGRREAATLDLWLDSRAADDHALDGADARAGPPVIDSCSSLRPIVPSCRFLAFPRSPSRAPPT